MNSLPPSGKSTAGPLPNPHIGKPTRNGANPQPNPQKQPTTPPKFDPKQAAKMDHVRRSGLTITPTEIQPKLVLTDLLVTSGHGVSQQDLKDNSFLRKCAAILDRKETLDTNQQKRLAEITQRRTPPTVETPQPEQEAVGYADILYSSVQSGFGWVSSLASYRPSMAGVSMALTVASSVADQFPATRPLSQGMSLVAGAVTLANGAIGLSQEATNYIEGKKVNLWNVGSSAAQTLSGTGMLTGGSAVRTASVFASTGLQAAKAFQTQSLTDAGAAIVGALSLAVGGDSVALANTVLAYSNLIQGGVSVWRKLEADAAQKAEVAALRQLVTVLETGVETDSEAQAVIAKARAVLKSPEVDRLPQTSALGKLFHSFRNLPETATHTLGLLLSPLCSLGKPSSSNLGTYLAGSLLGLSLLPGANAQSVNQQFRELRLIAAGLNVTATKQAQQIKDIQETQAVIDVKLIEVQDTQNETIVTLKNVETKQVKVDGILVEVQEIQGNTTKTLVATQAELALQKQLTENLNAELALQQQLTGNLTVALEKSNAAIAASNEAIAANKADNQYTRDVAFKLAGVGVAAIGIAVLAYTLKHCFFETQDTPGAKKVYAMTKEELIEEKQKDIATARETLGTLQKLWDVRNALHTEVTHDFIDPAAVEPAKPEILGELRGNLNTLDLIIPMTSADMTSDSFVRFKAIIKGLKGIHGEVEHDSQHPARIAVTALTEQIQEKRATARARIDGNRTTLPMDPPYIELTGQTLNSVVVPSFRDLNRDFALEVNQNLANTVIALVLNPGDIGRNVAPEALTVAHVTAMATALKAYITSRNEIDNETNAIKNAALRVFEATTDRLGWLSADMRAPLKYEIQKFTATTAAITADRATQTLANFRVALESSAALNNALIDEINSNTEYVTGIREDVEDQIETLGHFRALGLRLLQTAEATITKLHNDALLPKDEITHHNLNTLDQAAFAKLATAVTAANTVAEDINTEINSIKAAALVALNEQGALNQRLLATLRLTNPIGLLIGQFAGTRAAITDDIATQTHENLQAAMNARAALREDIITYINNGRQAIAQTLTNTDADITALTDLRRLAEDVEVSFDGTATQNSLDILQSANLPAEATDITLDDVTGEQFTALAAALLARGTFAGTIAGETRDIQAGLVAKLDEERQRIAALHPRLRERLAAELGTFGTGSATITDQADTQTLANFETVFAAIGAVDTAAAAARETAALLYKAEVQAQLQAQQGINARLGALGNSIDPTLFQTFEETSAIALRADATIEQLEAANTAGKALSDAIEAAQEASNNSNEVRIDLTLAMPLAAAAEEKGGAPQDGDIEQGDGGGSNS